MEKVDCRECKIPKFFHQYFDQELTRKDIEELEAYLSKYPECKDHFVWEKRIREEVKKKNRGTKISKELRKKINLQLIKKKQP